MEAPNQENGLYIGDLDENVTAQDIFEHFKSYGLINQNLIKVNHRDNKKFAFLYFKSK